MSKGRTIHQKSFALLFESAFEDDLRDGVLGGV